MVVENQRHIMVVSGSREVGMRYGRVTVRCTLRQTGKVLHIGVNV